MFRKTISVILCFLVINIGYMHPRLSYAQEKADYNIAVLDLEAHGISEAEAKSLSNNMRVQVTRLINSEKFKKTTDI